MTHADPQRVIAILNAERDAARAEVARLQREKAVAVAIANDREHNEHALETKVARLRAALDLVATLYEAAETVGDKLNSAYDMRCIARKALE